MASQTQLTTFGKSTEVTRPRPRNVANSNRVLGAILASQATLSRLDATIKSVELSRRQQPADSSTKVDKPKLIPSRPSEKNCNTRQNDATDQNDSSSTTHQSTAEGTSNGNLPPTLHSNGPPTGGMTSGNGISGGSDGNGEDPNWNRKKKTDPEDKKDDADEEDVDLYSDIESVDEENNSTDTLPKNEVNLIMTLI